MSKNSYIQEIIIVSASRFANREYCEKKPEIQGKKPEKNASLKEACWNGMLKDMMPELFFHFDSDSKMYMWQMREGERLLTMEMSEEPSELDFQASIDPYIVMEIQVMN